MTKVAEDINGVDTATLRRLVGELKEHPEAARCEFRLKNEWVSGDKNRSRVHDFFAAGSEQYHKHPFDFEAGEPAIFGGHDDGANPVEFLLSALSSCITTTLVNYAALNGITVEKMESSYVGDLDARGLFGLDRNVRPGYQAIHVRFRIKTDGTQEQFEKFYHYSPVYDVVSKSVPVEIAIDIVR